MAFRAWHGIIAASRRHFTPKLATDLGWTGVIGKAARLL
jgi:hypothetical protein